MHIVLLCATNRGLRVLETLLQLSVDDRITVLSFREAPGEPLFFDAIRETTLAAGHDFFEGRNVGSEKLQAVWNRTPVDLLLAVSWRYMVPPNIYERVTRGAYVIHDSLLPEYRGFSPTVWAIADGADHTGATLFEMVEEVDAGRIVDQVRVPIGPDDAIPKVMDDVTSAYLELLRRNWKSLYSGVATLQAQDYTQATYRPKRTSDDNRIDWNSSATKIRNLVRAVTAPYPGAFTCLGAKRLVVWGAERRRATTSPPSTPPGAVVEVCPQEGVWIATGDEPLFVTKVQIEGKSAACAADVLRCEDRLGIEAPMNLDQITIPFNRSSLVGDELKFVAQAMQSGRTSGDQAFTKKCQQLLEEVTGTRRALLTTSCTHALEMSALLLEIGPGDEVIVPSFTFVSTANAFALRGAKIVFADICPDTLNLDHEQLESLVTPRTKAIVVVHYAGVACEMDVVMEVAGRHGIPVVEDNAHGLFGKYRGRSLGSFGCLATQSFHETKNISCGEGGALLINDRTLEERAEILREKGTNRSRFFRGQVDKYTWVDVGSSYVPSDVLAAMLYGQLVAAETVQAIRRELWDSYDECLNDWALEHGVRTPTVPEHCEQSYHMYYLLLPSLELRTGLIDWLKRRGILSVFHYVPLHRSEMGLKLGAAPAGCLVTESVSDRLLRLPFFCGLTRLEQRRVVDGIRDYFASVRSFGGLKKRAA